MNGIRFYQEKDYNNVIAVFYDNSYFSGTTLLFECVSAVYFEDNSQVSGSSVSSDYLQKDCKRVSEKTARKIHPAMFQYLDHGKFQVDDRVQIKRRDLVKYYLIGGIPIKGTIEKIDYSHYIGHNQRPYIVLMDNGIKSSFTEKEIKRI